MALDYVETTAKIKLCLVARSFSCASTSKERPTRFSSTHTCNGQRINITEPGGPKNTRVFFIFEDNHKVDQTKKMPRLGKTHNVAEGSEIPSEKKVKSLRTTLCTPGLSEFSVKSLRLKPAHILLQTVVSAVLTLWDSTDRGTNLRNMPL